MYLVMYCGGVSIVAIPSCIATCMQSAASYQKQELRPTDIMRNNPTVLAFVSLVHAVQTSLKDL